MDTCTCGQLKQDIRGVSGLGQYGSVARLSVVSVEALGHGADVGLSVHPDLPENPLSLLQALGSV